VKLERIKRLSWRTWVIIVIVASLTSAFGTAYVLSQSSSQPITIEPASFTETASYTISGEDTDNDGVLDIIYAKNGTTGEIEFSGTDASQVIQQAIDALKVSYGTGYRLIGKIFFKAGDYELKTPLNLAKTYIVYFEGESGGNEASPTRLLIATNDVGIDLTGARFCTFKNIVFKTQTGYTPKALILLARDSSGDSAGDHLFERCVFYGDAEYGLVYNYGSEGNMFRSCFFWSKRRAIVLTASNILGMASPYTTIASGVQSLLQNFFDGCTFYRVSTPTGETILLDGGGSHIFTRCFSGGGTLYFFKIDFTNVDNVYGVVVRECNFEAMFLTVDDQTANKFVLGWRIENNYFGYANGGVYIDCNKTNVSFKSGIIKGNRALYGQNCEFQFWKVYLSTIDVGESFYPIKLTINVLDKGRIRGWKDYTTITAQVNRPLNKIEYVDVAVENSGTATIANGEWLPHGLAGTPTVVTVTTLTPTYDGVPVVVGVASKNATHIQISAYWTNGTAITDDAIDISWYAKYQP